MYYPKSQIVTDLYTNGGELTLEGKNYMGYYWRTSDRKYFSGRNPDGPSKELELGIEKRVIKTSQGEIRDPKFSDENIGYTRLKGYENLPIQSSPTVYVPIPTESDYQRGEFQRYFCYKNNNKRDIIEISEQTYAKLINKDSSILFSQYTQFTLPWSLTNSKVNRNIIELTDKQLRFNTIFIQWWRYYHSFNEFIK